MLSDVGRDARGATLAHLLPTRDQLSVGPMARFLAVVGGALGVEGRDPPWA